MRGSGLVLEVGRRYLVKHRGSDLPFVVRVEQVLDDGWVSCPERDVFVGGVSILAGSCLLLSGRAVESAEVMP